MKLVATREKAEAVVILSSGFENVGDWVFFADDADAKKFAAENDGRVVDQDGLAEKFGDMHRATGRTPNQSQSGRFLEGDAGTDWDQVWDKEYSEEARDAFGYATVYKIEDDEEMG